MSEGWQYDPATDMQKEKLRFLGCTWESNITKGQASDAISEYVRLFPEKEREWQSRPATAEQEKLIREMGEENRRGMTYSEAKDLIGDYESVPTEAEEREEEMELRIEGGLIGLYNWEYKPKVSRKRVREAIEHLDKTKPGWESTGELIETLEALKPAPVRRGRKTQSSQEQGCLSVLVVCFLVVWAIAKLILSR